MYRIIERRSHSRRQHFISKDQVLLWIKKKVFLEENKTTKIMFPLLFSIKKTSIPRSHETRTEINYMYTTKPKCQAKETRNNYSSQEKKHMYKIHVLQRRTPWRKKRKRRAAPGNIAALEISLPRRRRERARCKSYMSCIKRSPLVNLPKKTTTHIKALEKEESRNKINFLFFLPSFQPTLSKNQKQKKGKDRKIHLILFSSIKKIFCRSKQNKKKKKEEKTQNDASPSHLLSRKLSFEETGEEKMRETRV